jgi:type VI secretion system protein ImpA
MDLLQPVAPEAPCGESLEDSQLLLSFDEFRLFGRRFPFDLSGRSLSEDEKKANPTPEWGDLRARSLEALAKSKDLRVLTHLAGALIRTDGLAEFADTVTVAADWLEQYWATVFPLVDEDGVSRRSALNCFADPMAVIDGVRRAPIVQNRQHGTFSLRDIELATGLVQPAKGEPKPDDNQIAAAFVEMPLDELQPLHTSVAAGLRAIKRIDTAVTEHAGSELAPALDLLATSFGRIEQYLGKHLTARLGTAPGQTADAAPPEGGAAALGAIKSRQDAIRALEAVATFFRSNEPSSPIPFFVERAKRLISKDFLEVLADITPDAVTQAKSAVGLRE